MQAMEMSSKNFILFMQKLKELSASVKYGTEIVCRI